MGRARPEPARRRHPSAERLRIAEKLLTSTEAAEAAGHAAAWIVEQGLAERIWIGQVAGSPPRLSPLACAGSETRSYAPEEIPVSESSENGLAEVVRRDRPVYFPQTPDALQVPVGPGPMFAIPLRATRSEDPLAIGVLLVSAREYYLDPDVLWVSQVLAGPLSRMRSAALIAESQSTRERRLLHSMITAITDPVLLTDHEGRILIANARAERLLSAPDDASEGLRRAVAVNNMLFSSALTSAGMEAEETRHELTLVDTEDGTDLLFELIATPVRDPREGTAVVAVLRNITDLGRAAEELRETSEKLRAAEAVIRSERHRLDLIIDSVVDPIVITDASGGVAMMNRPAERIFQLPHGSPALLRRQMLSNDAHFSSFVSRLLSAGSDLRYRGEIVLYDLVSETPTPFEAVAGKVLTETGELTAIVTIFHDRTEALENARLLSSVEEAREKLEQRVRSATAELARQNVLLRRQAEAVEQASNLKSQFLANMSHEFRTPLNAILGFTNMLLGGYRGEISEPVRKALERVDNNSRHLLAIINEILDISRIESGRMPVTRSNFALAGVVRDVLSELAPIIERSKLAVSARIPEEFPALETDRQKVKQILTNLVSNAIKFTPSGSVRVRARLDGRLARIDVVDTGKGIDPANHETIFEEFRQVDGSTTRPHGGTGLGLAICRRFATMLHGRIEVKSALGKGSTFTLVLPLRLRRRADGGVGREWESRAS